MTNAAESLALFPYGQGGRKVTLPVDGGSAIYKGTMVSQLTATAMLVAGSTASSGPAIGVAEHDISNTSGSDSDVRCSIQTDRIFLFANGTSTDACSEATPMFSVVYMGDDHTVFDNSNGSTLQPAGRFWGMEPDGKVRVFVGTSFDALATAALVSISDTGTFTAATDVEAALAELYQNLRTTNASVGIPLASFVDADGDPLAKFVSAGSPTFGFNLADSEALNIRWNNDATPGTALCQLAIPSDLDDTADATLEFLCSKSGATVGDATTLLVSAFIISTGDLHDADANCGGTTDALVGNATAKTTKTLTLTLTAANIPASPSSMTFTVTPTAGVLGTDDLMLHSVRLRYKRKVQIA